MDLKNKVQSGQTGVRLDVSTVFTDDNTSHVSNLIFIILDLNFKKVHMLQFKQTFVWTNFHVPLGVFVLEDA